MLKRGCSTTRKSEARRSSVETSQRVVEARWRKADVRSFFLQKFKCGADKERVKEAVTEIKQKRAKTSYLDAMAHR
jgi:hypothetical protein